VPASYRVARNGISPDARIWAMPDRRSGGRYSGTNRIRNEISLCVGGIETNWPALRIGMMEAACTSPDTRSGAADASA
jgi:hypothetical protein